MSMILNILDSEREDWFFYMCVSCKNWSDIVLTIEGLLLKGSIYVSDYC